MSNPALILLGAFVEALSEAGGHAVLRPELPRDVAAFLPYCLALLVGHGHYR